MEHLREIYFHIFYTSKFISAAALKSLCAQPQNSVGNLCSWIQKEYQFILEENRKYLCSIKGKFSGSNAHISEMKGFKIFSNFVVTFLNLTFPCTALTAISNNSRQSQHATHHNIMENKPSQSSQMTYSFCHKLMAF